MEMHRNLTNKLQIQRPKLATITDTSLQTNASQSTLSPSPTMDTHAEDRPEERGKPRVTE